MKSSEEYAVELLHITKRYGNYAANEDVTIRLKRGEIHALLGENGAGKSTLMNILFGLVKPDSGEIRLHGKPIVIKNPNDATANGIGMVHQHFKQVECFTVLQNIILGMEDTTCGVLKLDEAEKKVRELSDRYRFDIDPHAKISDITVGMQQRVEILKMLYRENDILIFDEPTAVLTPQEIEELLEQMKELAQSGKSILFITHKLNEIKAIADRCSVIRKGKYIDTLEVASVSEEELSECMMGRKVNLVLDKPPCTPKDDILRVENLSVYQKGSKKKAVDGVSFCVRGGEIVCIAGIDGNGQSELVYALTGLEPAAEGKIFLNQTEITNMGVRDRTCTGMAHVPEDRLKYGLVSDATVEENLILQSYYTDRFQKNGVLQFDQTQAFADDLIQQYNVTTSKGREALAGELSGGNQQKMVIAREFSREPALIIAAQPVRGLDVGAIEYIHQKLLDARSEGRGVLLVSFELSEVMNLADRILVMFEGKIVANLRPEDTDTKELGLYMAGGVKHETTESVV